MKRRFISQSKIKAREVEASTMQALYTLCGSMQTRYHSARKLVLIGQGACGGSSLFRALHSAGNFSYFEEALSKPVRRPLQYLEGIASLHSRRGRFWGTKLKFWQLAKVQNLENCNSFIQTLEVNGWKFIHVWRENVFQQAVTVLCRLKNRGGASDFEKGVAYSPVTLDPDSVVDAIRGKLAEYERERSLLRGVDYISIEYAKDILDPDQLTKTCESIQRHVGVQVKPLRLARVPAMPSDLRTVVDNFDAVELALRLAGFGHFLAGHSERCSAR